MQANAEFFVYTKTPAASHMVGFITDDFSSEFDPASPSFGEKFAVTNVPISIKDYNGLEVSRVYSDQWGEFNGLVYSTWEVDPPNITGYSPNMMLTCMNDPGPVPGPNGTMITDPYYNPNYSDYCYENPFMPADTDYMDTPVVPTAAFAQGYNPPDCAYPDATPAIARVTGDSSGGGAGPWLNASGSLTLTITALGDKTVANHAYSGPAANTAPYNQKTVTRHYGFGSTPGTVTVGGVALTGVSWSDTTITGTVPSGFFGSNVPLCALQQSGTSNGGARCGELVITAANGQQSVDTVTVTIGGKAPTYVNGENSSNNALQTAIDKAAPGDLIIVGPGTYNEMLLMWKPVRLQGVGAASSVVNANAHPAGVKLEPWRRQVDCLFGLALNGGFSTGTSGKNPFDPTGTYTCAFTTPQVDPLPLEPVVGWDATLNGNIAELLQEPTLMGAYEGAGITVLGKGLENNNTANCNPTSNAGCVPLNNSTAAGGDCNTSSPFYGSNFLCNPSRIDGMTFTNSSQGGGGIFLHGWNHYLEVSNNRVFNNSGTLTGGIVVGETETPPANIDALGNQLPLLFNSNVSVHNNSITQNTAYGDELNSNTPASAGGVTFCDGSDYYKFSYNWVCGNLSMGDGGGVAHFGFSWNGDIEHNSIVFNQSSNPTLTTYGGGLIAEGVGPDGTLCENGAVDVDCPPELSDGIGPGLTINANLIMGNTAESGSGGGLRLQHVNGTEVQRNPNSPNQWYQVSVTNNIIANNVAGWTGGGVSLLDAVNVNFINNTVVSNDTTASAGVLFDTNSAPNANVPPPGCDPTITPPPPACTNASVTTSSFMPAGLETEKNSGLLSSVFSNPSVTCLPGHPQCTMFSNPVLENNLFWQNRSFHITTVPPSSVVQLQPALTQTATGGCPSGATYWDIGVYGDTSASNHASGFTLQPTYSILTDASDYPGAQNLGSNPSVVHQYCDGSRVPPEIAPQLCTSNSNAPGCIQPGTEGLGITVPGGIPDSTYAGPLFTLSPAATVDEGSNWINMFYGPLALSNPTISKGGTGYGLLLGNYSITSGSPAFNAGSPTGAPSQDFFGTARPQGGAWDIGAVELVAGGGGSTGAPMLNIAPDYPVSFGAQVTNTSSAQMLTVSNTGNAPLTISSINVSGGLGSAQFTSTTTCPASLAPGGSCVITVTFLPTSTGAKAATLNVNVLAPATSQHVPLSGTGVLRFTVAPASLTFTSAVGGSMVLAVTITNPAGNTPLSLTSIGASFTGPASSDFTWETIRVQPNNCGASLSVGSSCTISATFSPSPGEAVGTIDAATMTISGSLANLVETQNVSLSGTVSGVTLSPSALTFGTQNVGTTSAAQTVTINNPGTSPQTISISFSTTEFARPSAAAGGTCSSSVAAGASCTINVTFSPTTAGPRPATLTVTGVGSVSLSGTGFIPPPTLSPTSLTFGSQNVGTTSAAQTVTLNNPGIAAQPISISFSTTEFARPGGSAGGTCASSVAAGASCTINVTFRPAATGSRTATFTVAGVGSVSLSGTGITPPPPTLSPASLTFGSQNVGTTSAAQTVTLNNPGIAAQPISIAFSTTEFARPAGFAGGTCASSVAAGASCTINVTFRPAATGLRTATLTVAGVGSVSLNGTGITPPPTLSPTSLTFGSQNVGTTSAAQTVTLNNPGAAAQPVSISFSTTEFAQPSGAAGGSCGNSVAAGASCTINVTFTPAATGLRTATLTVAGVGNVSLSGTGITPPPPTLSPASLTFGSQNVGTTSAAQTVTLNNPGIAAQPISISFSTTEFARPGGSAGGTCASSVAAGASCTINVTFTPAATGLRTATLTVTGVGNVPLSGTGVTSVVTLSPTTLTFAAQNVGSTSSPQLITVNNPGATAQPVSVTFSTTEFAQPFLFGGTCRGSVNPGSSCTIAVTFTPAATGLRTATLTVAGVGSVSLSGTGR